MPDEVSRLASRSRWPAAIEEAWTNRIVRLSLVGDALFQSEASTSKPCSSNALRLHGSGCACEATPIDPGAVERSAWRCVRHLLRRKNSWSSANRDSDANLDQIGDLQASEPLDAELVSFWRHCSVGARSAIRGPACRRSLVAYRGAEIPFVSGYVVGSVPAIVGRSGSCGIRLMLPTARCFTLSVPAFIISPDGRDEARRRGDQRGDRDRAVVRDMDDVDPCALGEEREAKMLKYARPTEAQISLPGRSLA